MPAVSSHKSYPTFARLVMLEPAELGGGVQLYPQYLAERKVSIERLSINACTPKFFRPFAGTVMLHRIVCSQHSTEWMKLGGFETN